MLNRVSITANEDQKMLFYSSMYRLFEQPENIADVGQAADYSTLSL